MTTPAGAEVIRYDQATVASDLKEPIYMWSNPDTKPRAVAIAVHGLTMHGGTFDVLANSLANQGFLVLAPDLHGYGRWLTQPEQKRKCETCGSLLCYMKSRRDLISLIEKTREKYPTLPLFVIGESLGADLALYSASQRPGLIDGLVLSAPAVKRRWNLVPRVARDIALVMNNPFREVDLIPYMKKFASEDPAIVEEAVHDPLVRKKLTLWQLFKTCKTIHPTLAYADKVPANMPVLVIQGDKDRMLRTNAVVQLMDHLHSTDQTIRWFKDRGHLLLETHHVQPDTLSIVEGWLKEHVDSLHVVQASVQGTVQRQNYKNEHLPESGVTTAN